MLSSRGFPPGPGSQRRGVTSPHESSKKDREFAETLCWKFRWRGDFNKIVRRDKFLRRDQSVRSCISGRLKQPAMIHASVIRSLPMAVNVYAWTVKKISRYNAASGTGCEGEAVNSPVIVIPIKDRADQRLPRILILCRWPGKHARLAS